MLVSPAKWWRLGMGGGGCMVAAVYAASGGSASPNVRSTAASEQTRLKYRCHRSCVSARVVCNTAASPRVLVLSRLCSALRQFRDVYARTVPTLSQDRAMEPSAKGAKNCDFGGRLGPRGHCGPRLGLRSQIKDASDGSKVSQEQISVTIKRESSDDDFKEYAETAMNELLGWYGYSNNNKQESSKQTDLAALRRPANNAPEADDKPDHQLDTPSQHAGSHVVETRRSSGNSSGSESPKSADMCGWCGKSVDDTTGLSSNDALFCSELCFSQSRRANFKKNKTCDWCKHVRHTVSYVDFQDGASQLQFCSDKCLNQYKMHIFCRETRAHLEMHPHLITDDTTSGLITPDLWMRNCRSPSSRASSPPPSTVTPGRLQDDPQTSPLPLITVAHPSKLLSACAGISGGTSRVIPTGIPSIHSIPGVPVVVHTSEQEKNGSHSRRKRLRKRTLLKTSLLTTNDEAQDLRVHLRRSFEPPRGDRDAGSTPQSSNQFPELAARLCATSGSAGGTSPHGHRPHATPDFPPHSSTLPITLQPFRGTTGGVLPPVTVMVPYPILLPVPIPIPIPLPFSAFLAAANLSQQKLPPTGRDTTDANTTKLNTHTAQSEDEEIVVDDDSRLHGNPNQNGSNETTNQNGDHQSDDSAILEQDGGDVEVPPTRKRNHEITPQENYKLKKSLSV